MTDWFRITPGKIAAFSLLCVAVSSGFVLFMQIKLTNILAAPDWCARAINAEKLAAPRQQSALDSCVSLLDKQVGSLAINSHIFAGIIALCLLVLVVIVLAGGRLSLRVSKEGADVDLSRQSAATAAEQVAGAAVEEAVEIREG